MKIRSLKFIVAFICIAASMFLLKSCKKQDQKNNALMEKSKQEVIANFKAKNPNLGVETIISIKQKFSYSYYTDKKGVEKMAGYKDNNNSSLRFTHCSDAFCPDPLANIYDPEQQLAFLGRIYFCTKGTSDISVSWNISVPNTLELSNPLNNAQKSIGKIWMKSSSNVNIIYNTALVPVITSSGVDPNCSFHNVYQVSYTLKDIPQYLFSNNSDYKIVTQPVIYFGCNTFMTAYVGPVATYSTTTTYGGVDTDGGTGILDACHRTDKCYTTESFVFGGYMFCTYFSPYPTDKHRYEYRKKTSTTNNEWSAQTSTIEWGLDFDTNVATHDFFPYSMLKLPDMILGSGTWIVRYQNFMNYTCSPDAPWVEEVDTY